MLDGMSSETELLRASIRGDPAAFETIVGKYQSLVCAITFSATANVDKSEELAQEAFVRAWTNLAQLEDLSKFRSWLCAIARNIVRNYLRDKKRDVVGRAASLDRISDISSGKSKPVDVVIDREQEAVIRRALEQIPESYREPLVLFYRDQRSLRQVAEQLDLSEEAARTRVHRARKLLREQVAAMVEDAIGRTGPGRAFTAGVVASIAGMAIKGSGVATAVGIGTAASARGATAVIKRVVSGMAGKIIAAAAVVVIGVGTAIVYKQVTKPDQDPDLSPPSNAAQDRQRREDEGPEKTGGHEQTNATKIFVDENTVSDISIQGEADSMVAKTKAAESVGDDPNSGRSGTGISGVVIDKATSKPIEGARVFCSVSEQRYSVIADANGHFAFLDMQPNERQSVNVIAKGYATRRVVLEVVKDRARTDVKIELARGSGIAGIVTDESGKPITGATVRTFRFTNHPVTTSKDGEFEIDGLDPGLEQCSLHVTHPNYPAVSVWFAPPEAGQTILKDVVLKPGVTVHGRVTDSAGDPVAGVVVGTTTSRAMWNSVKSKADAEGKYTFRNVSLGELVLWVVTNEHAPYVERFFLDGSQDNRLIDIRLDDPWPLRGKIIDRNGDAVPGLRARIWDYRGVRGLSTHEDYVTCDSGGRFVIPNAPATGKVTIAVYGEGISRRETELEMGLEEYVITVDRAGRLYGKVVDDVTGEPIRKFTVRLKYTDRGSNPGYSYSASWTRRGHSFHSAEGLFDTGKEGLTIGAEYSLTVIADGFDPLTIDPVVVPETAEDSARIEFRLKPATTVTGRIVDTNDVPIAGARIHVLIEKTASYYDNYNSQDTAVSDSNGRFSLSGLGKFPREIYVTAESFGSYGGSSRSLPRDSDNSVRIVLAPSAHVFGRVFGPDGQAVPNVRMYASATPREIRTGVDGYYEFTDLPAGSIRVSAYSSTNFAAKRIETTPGRSVELNFGDEPGLTVSGVVRTGQVPVARASVRVNLPDLTYQGGRTDDHGRFHIRGIPKGLWDLEIGCALDDEHLEERREIVVDANMELDLDLGAATVGGKIPDSIVATDELKIGIWRWAPKTYRDHLGLRADWDAAGTAKLDTDGTFTCSYLRPGRYYLSLLERREILGISDIFELGESEYLDDVSLRTGNGGIDISLRDLDTGEKVASADLLLENHLEDTFREMSTDEQGRAECSRLPSGRYILLIEAPGYSATRSDWITVHDGVLTPVTIYMERGSAVIFVLSDQVCERIPSPTAWISCRITDLHTGKSVSKPKIRLSGYREYDGHELHFKTDRASPAIYLGQGRYEIRYTLRQVAYAYQPPLLEGVASVDLAKGQTTTILVTDD